MALDESASCAELMAALATDSAATPERSALRRRVGRGEAVTFQPAHGGAAEFCECARGNR
jgi:hypothetical protein